MVNVAMYDAVNGSTRAGTNDDRRTRSSYPQRAAEGDEYAAAVAAAHAVLPASTRPAPPTITRNEMPTSRRSRQKDRTDAGRRMGPAGRRRRCARRGTTTARRPTSRGRPARGSDSSAPPGRACSSATSRRSGSPTRRPTSATGRRALPSLDYAAAFASVKLLGDGRIPDAGKLATFQYWSLGAGTSQPPGAWIQVALLSPDDRGLTLAGRDPAARPGEHGAGRHRRPDLHDEVQATALAADDRHPRGRTRRQRRHGPRPELDAARAEHRLVARVLVGPQLVQRRRGGRARAASSAPTHPVHARDRLGAGGQPRIYPSFSAAAAEAGIRGWSAASTSRSATRKVSPPDKRSPRRSSPSSLLAERGPTHAGTCPL